MRDREWTDRAIRIRKTRRSSIPSNWSRQGALKEKSLLEGFRWLEKAGGIGILEYWNDGMMPAEHRNDGRA
jgi:hypothetical protein